MQAVKGEIHALLHTVAPLPRPADRTVSVRIAVAINQDDEVEAIANVGWCDTPEETAKVVRDALWRHVPYRASVITADALAMDPPPEPAEIRGEVEAVEGGNA